MTVVLLQDAVLCALQVSGLPGADRLRGLVAAGAHCHYLAEDLAMRGFEDADVMAGCTLIDYDQLVEVL